MRVRPRLSNNNLISISVEYEIRIVRDNDYLTVRLGFDEQLYQFVEDRFRIKVLFWLVNKKWSVVFVIQTEIEKQKDYPVRVR